MSSEEGITNAMEPVSRRTRQALATAGKQKQQSKDQGASMSSGSKTLGKRKLKQDIDKQAGQGPSKLKREDKQVGQGSSQVQVRWGKPYTHRY